VVLGNTYDFPSAANGTFVSIPGWYQYCLGFQLAANRVSLAINGRLVVANFSISILKNGNSSIRQSNITARNEMFSYVNLHSGDITQVK
jgi:hypothetical protein